MTDDDIILKQQESAVSVFLKAALSFLFYLPSTQSSL